MIYTPVYIICVRIQCVGYTMCGIYNVCVMDCIDSECAGFDSSGFQGIISSFSYIYMMMRVYVTILSLYL